MAGQGSARLHGLLDGVVKRGRETGENQTTESWNRMNWKDYASIVTGAFSFVLLILVGSVNGTVGEIKTQLFTHLTNHEMHTSRTVVDDQLKNKVSVDQFVIYQTMRDRQISEICSGLLRIEEKLDRVAR